MSHANPHEFPLRRTPERSEIPLDPRIVLTEGWYRVEKVSGKPARWTARRFAWRFTGTEATRFELKCFLPSESRLEDLRATISSRGTTFFRLKIRPGWNDYSFLLSGTQHRNRDVIVELSHSWVPARLQINSDARELGVLAGSLSVSDVAGPRKARRFFFWPVTYRKKRGPSGSRTERESPTTSADSLFEFEECFRGPRDLIKERQRAYLDCFGGRWNVLDLGSGRGEFLELLRENGNDGWGIEINPHLVEYCVKRGLRVVEDDVLSYLPTLGDGTLDGVFSAQLLEHLSADQRKDLLRCVMEKLKPGGILVAETVNPKCLSVFSDGFYVDPSHIVPIPPELLVFELKALGFEVTEVRYSSSVEEERRLPPLPAIAEESELRKTLEQWRTRLNTLLFGDRDYAVVARRPLEAAPAYGA